jgi:hypothetical protein
VCLITLSSVARGVRIRDIGAERFHFLAVQETETCGSDEENNGEPAHGFRRTHCEQRPCLSHDRGLLTGQRLQTQLSF